MNKKEEDAYYRGSAPTALRAYPGIYRFGGQSG